jgi:DNA-binding FadR family transcriptional regulator
VPRGFSVIPADLATIDDVLCVLELRIGIEAEAARLAAERRTDEDLQRLEDKLVAIDDAIRAGETGAEQDFAFHRAILVATHNAYYARLIDAFGSTMIPRQWAPLETMGAGERRQHTARMKREHRAILGAIRDRREMAAQKALRTHLARSAARFAELRHRTSLSGSRSGSGKSA